MKLNPKPWLPKDAVDPTRITALIDRALVDWSKHWFKAEQANASPAFQDDWPEANASTKCRSFADAASVALTPNAQTAVASAMLGCPIPNGSIQANDRAIIESLATAAADDLLAKIAELSGETHGSPREHGDSADLSDCQWWDISFRSGNRAIKLGIGFESRVKMARRQLPDAPKRKLQAVQTGLAEQKVELTVDLGLCSIALSELRDLGAGDVLVLDRSCKEPIELLIDGFSSPVGGKLESIDGQICVVLDPLKEYRNA